MGSFVICAYYEVPETHLASGFLSNPAMISHYMAATTCSTRVNWIGVVQFVSIVALGGSVSTAEEVGAEEEWSRL